MPFKQFTVAMIALLFSAASGVADEFPTETALPNALVDPLQVTHLSSDDSSQIREVIARIYLAEDARTYGAFASLLTDDYVQEHSVYGRLEGSAAFVDWLKANPQAFDRYRHMALNTVTRALGAQSAEALSYILVLDLHPAPGSNATALPRILAHGVVRDTLRKEDGLWRVSQRVYDQFAVSAAVVPDRSARLAATREIEADPDR